ARGRAARSTARRPRARPAPPWSRTARARGPAAPRTASCSLVPLRRRVPLGSGPARTLDELTPETRPLPLLGAEVVVADPRALARHGDVPALVAQRAEPDR